MRLLLLVRNLKLSLSASHPPRNVVTHWITFGNSVRKGSGHG